ncbi:beta-lactamase [Advenella kashmirensis W13003]|uniref:Beta-lactamase n=1 Tax=Advenella kashmirensis W13003 TaxID=1424334 RepID=V8QWA6_9BURK|nr:quinoprotein relay system zinc metallohydrolase 2 [Advenella kashmirensis]ETF04221.1 beta-lactamase [Advenella kashmirensis W13003]
MCFARIGTVLLGMVITVGAAQAVPLPVQERAPGVYVHQGSHQDFDDADYDGDIANIGFVVGEQAVAVIDTGGSYDIGLALKQAVEKATSLPIRYVINTHLHPDHVLGNAAFAGDGVQFVGHAKLAAALYESQDTYLRDAPSRADGVKNAIVLPTIKVSGQTTLDLGGRRLLLESWPSAHTTTDLTVLDEQTQTLWTGDLLFTERTPSVDGDVKGWLRVMDTLEHKRVSHLIPGHGSSPQDATVAWDAQRRYLTTLLADIRKGIDAGQDMSEVMQHAAAQEKNKWQRFDVINPRNVNLLFPKMEWE